MLTYGDLLEKPDRIAELGGSHVLVAAATPGPEIVVREAKKSPEATVVFHHETIAMMRAERADQLEKLRKQLNAASLVVPIRKESGSFWDEAQVTVGRASTADLVLNDPAVSNVHAHFEIGVHDRSVCVKDLGSSNGTFLNRQPLQPHELTPLRTGDCVRFGQSVFYFIGSDAFREMFFGAAPGL